MQSNSRQYLAKLFSAGREIELTLVMGATVFCALLAIFVAKLLYIRILVGIVSS